MIRRRGKVDDERFIVGRGEVEVVDEEGNERVVNVLGEGDYFGEISFLRRTPRTATVRARTSTELHIRRRLDFDHLLEHLGGGGTLSRIEATARARIEDTREKLAVLSGWVQGRSAPGWPSGLRAGGLSGSPAISHPGAALKAAKTPDSASALLELLDRADEAGALAGPGVAELVLGAAVVGLRIEGILGLGG